MKSLLKITFRDMPSSKAIEDNIHEKANKLDSLYDDIMSCRVIVEAPHRHHHKGKAYVVRIDMTVPGGELVVNRQPKRLLAARAAHVKLQDYARRRRGKTKIHASTPLARVAKIFPIEDYGFLQTPDGREIYFHKNSVSPPGFDRLEIGTEVYYAEELGEKGPQATTVRVVGQ